MEACAAVGLTESDYAWLAGFLDGEGHLTIRYQRSKRDCLVTSTVATIAVSQAHPREAILYWMKESFGGTISCSSTGPRSAFHNKAYRWSITGAGAVEICRRVFPYLRLKRRQAELIIEHQGTKLPSHVGVRKGTPRSAVRISPEILALRQAHVEEISKLNKRGLPQKD